MSDDDPPPRSTESERETDRLKPDPATASLVMERVRIEVIEGPSRGVVVHLGSPRIRVGSHPDNDLMLEDFAVSRHHALIEMAGDRILVRDLGSTNGTMVDGTRVKEAYLAAGSTIRLGSSLLKVRTVSDRVALRPSERDRLGDLIGPSQRMREFFAILEKVAPTDLPVLIEAETGSGKELTAQAIHSLSLRHEEPYEILDSSALSADLLGSDLFGHVRGAFTGATEDRAGAIERADRGTLFIDEVGELPLELQPKFLRVLETSTVLPLGAVKPRTFQVRFIAATNRRLADLVSRGEFREDLYHRLGAVRLTIPPLRERIADIPHLVTHFIATYNRSRREDRSTIEGFSAEALQFLMSRDWPGNVRELRNVVILALSLARSETVEVEDLGAGSLLSDSNRPVPLELAGKRLDDLEREAIRATLEACRGNKAECARLLGISYKTMFNKLKKYRLS